VREEGDLHPIIGKEIQAGLGMNLLAHLINFIDGQGPGAYGNGGGGSKGQSGPQAMTGADDLPGQESFNCRVA